MRDWKAADELVDAQGCIAVRQLLELGIPRSSAYAWLERKGCTPLGSGRWLGPDGDTRDGEVRIRTVHMLGTNPKLLTGGARLAVAGVRRLVPRQLGFVVGPRASLPPLADVRWFRGAWVSGDAVERWQGVPCVPLLRAWTDAALVDRIDVLEKDLRALHRLRHAGPPEVAAYLERRGAFWGRPRAQAALDRVRHELVHSEAEALARGLLRRAGLRSVHPSPYAVVQDGRRVGEIDLPFCAIRYGVEVDGPHHGEPEQQALDARRDALLDDATWVIDRFPTTLLEQNPTEFVRQVLRGAGEAAARGLDPWPCGVQH
jgi:very-short-patch-repair endonuclease